ncbi:ribonuclease R [Cryomorphaceae bacterium 1068]|nr:ribonuclease R [Cryomorphaceae bacterium 1068]
MGKKKKKFIPKKGRSFSKSELRGNIMALLRGMPEKNLNYKQISARLGIENSNDRRSVVQLLDELVKSDLLMQVSQGKFQVHPSQMAQLRATLDFTKSGSAYAIPETDEKDIFISEKNTGKALHGDLVEIAIIGLNRGQAEGKVINILQRKAENYVGIIELSKNHAFFVPTNSRIHVDFFIDKSKTKNARNGQKVIVQLVDWEDGEKSPKAEVISVLGDPGVNEVEMHAILVEFDLPFEFPDSVLNAAEKVDVTISEEEIKRRRDFRKHTTFTIDPDDAKDFDDALSINSNEDGTYEVGIHIADVSHYVKPGSELEEEALKRATSVYLVDRVVPMLPEVLSNYVCSLRPNEEKLCMSAVFQISEDGKIMDEWFGKTIIESDHRFTYEDAQAIIEGADTTHPLKEDILLFQKWASRYRKARISSGALEFSGVEVKFQLDESGKPVGVFEKKMREANKLIEEFMLMANKRVAAFIGKPDKNKSVKTFVYRVHDTPDPEKLFKLKEFVSRLGYKLKSTKPENASFALNDLLHQVKDQPEEDAIKIMAIRTMAKAVYTTENIGHYGLAFDYYTHFTSPIRRYPDVMVHRLLEAYSNGATSAKKDDLEKKCKHSSEREKKATEAERASIKYKQVEFMLDKIGENFQGHISGIARWGIYVELEGTKVEGMIPLSSMDDDIYRFDDRKNQIIGQRYKEVFEFGDKVNVKVHGADLIQKQLDFRMI